MSFLTCSNDHFNRKAVLILNFDMETKEKGTKQETCSNDHFNRKAVLILNLGMETKEKGRVPNRKPFLAAQL